MPELELIFANRNYSSWSLRGWLALRHARLDFVENELNHYTDEGLAQLKQTPAGLVPTMIEDGTAIWDSLAIIERANELCDGNLWPKSAIARAVARSVAAEMHSGFTDLRTYCPMNLKRKAKPITQPGLIAKDAARFVDIIAHTRGTFGQTGPFLFGTFSAADIMYTPLATRMRSYDVPMDTTTQTYVSTVLSEPHFLQWETQALAEETANPVTDQI